MVHGSNTRVPGTRPCTTPYEKEAMQSGILFGELKQVFKKRNFWYEDKWKYLWNVDNYIMPKVIRLPICTQYDTII